MLIFAILIINLNNILKEIDYEKYMNIHIGGIKNQLTDIKNIKLESKINYLIGIDFFYFSELISNKRFIKYGFGFEFEKIEKIFYKFIFKNNLECILIKNNLYFISKKKKFFCNKDFNCVGLSISWDIGIRITKCFFICSIFDINVFINSKKNLKNFQIKNFLNQNFKINLEISISMQTV